MRENTTMPTVGWIHEGDRDRWLESSGDKYRLFSSSVIQCPLCDFTAKEADTLSSHIATEHPLDCPRLIIGDREAPRLLEIFEGLQGSLVKVVNCDRIMTSINGGIERVLNTADFRSQLSEIRNGQIDAVLERHRQADGASVKARFNLRFEIAERGSLDQVDRAVVRLLARQDLNTDHISKFAMECAALSDARRYVDALAGYSYGILIKDQDPASGIHSPLSEYANKMKASLHILGGQRRRLAQAVATCIRLNLNYFGIASERSGIADLDYAMGIFEELSRRAPARNRTPKKTIGSDQPTGPGVFSIDRMTSAIMRLARDLPGPAHWNPAYEDEVTRLLSDPLTVEPDKAKLRTLLAKAALSSGKKAVAIQPLRGLANDAVFGAWATNQLQNLGIQ